AGEISAGATETIDEADPYRVGALHEDDRDRLGRLLGRKRSQRALQRHDHRYLTADQFGDQAWHAIVVALAPPVFDGDVLALDIAGISQSPVKIGQISARLVPRCQVKKSDYRHCRLLRACRERPTDGWASNYFDEIASSHCLPRG